MTEKINSTGLKIGGVPEHFNLPWRLAIESGKLNQMGLDVHWSDMTGGTGQMIRGLEAGSIDIAIVLTEGITKAILQGLNAKIFRVFVASPLHWGIHVPYSSSIQKISELENKTFAISRYGSGSHLMPYIIADQQGWNLDSLTFNVIGDVYGGLWALENNQAQAFLWEKYTTAPYVEQKKCRRIEDVITPWPCFVIAVREEVLATHYDSINKMCDFVEEIAKGIKSNLKAADVIAWRYNLNPEEASKWLSETEWNYDSILSKSEFKKVVDYLQKLKLVENSEVVNWEKTLFYEK